MPYSELHSVMLRYIVRRRLRPGDSLPTIPEMSDELSVSVSKLREDLAVARSLGLVQTKPRTGTQVQSFSFGPAATLSVLYALGIEPRHFYQFSQLRKSVELGFWHEAVQLLQPEDIEELRTLVCLARERLNSPPVEVPFAEHRALHLTFFKYLDNAFVQGILEAFWTAYRAFGIGVYGDLAYHREVWDYHARMVECVAQRDFEGGFLALKEHMNLMRYRDQDEPASQPMVNSQVIRHFFE